MSRIQKKFFRWFHLSFLFFSLATAVWIFFPSKTISLTTICIQNDHIAFWDLSDTYENSGMPESKDVLLNSTTCIGIWKPKDNGNLAKNTQGIDHPDLLPSEFLSFDLSYSNQFYFSFQLSRAPPLA